MRPPKPALLEITGAGFVVFGLALLALWAAFVVAGTLMVLAAWTADNERAPR
jgi:hypothetical protein